MRRNLLNWAVGVLIVLAISAPLVIYKVTHGDAHRHKPPKDHTDLAARINAACPKPDYVQDWTTGDEYTPVPAGTVKVTCVKTKDQSLYYVAVAR